MSTSYPYAKPYIDQLDRDYCDVGEVWNSVRLDVYLRVMKQLYKQAESYQGTNLDYEYIFLKKFCKLALLELPKHSRFKKDPYKPDSNWVSRKGRECLERLELVVAQIEDRERALAQEQEEYSLLDEFDEVFEPSRPVESEGRKKREEEEEERKRREEERKRREEERKKEEASMDFSEMAAILGQATENRRRSAVAEQRPLVLPDSLVPLFLDVSFGNSFPQERAFDSRGVEVENRGVETCGLLGGRLDSGRNRFVCSHIILPEQVGYSDNVDMVGEEALFSYCYEQDLLVLGWIHTHPSQDCFLSSVDLHTQLSYQLMLREAVAVVVSPRKLRRDGALSQVNERGEKVFGVFQLTDPEGLDVIRRCDLRGFHTHTPPENDVPIYQDALSTRPSHVQFDASLGLEVVDLRR